ncbi:uncharacterized protein [Amphiura filiformis]|uniref:uncharacterized protein n=1 Tax=Amphiura filiformis TaxID=82378 RepID=UPI003B2271E6
MSVNDGLTNNVDKARVADNFDYASEPCKPGWWPCDQTGECIPVTYFCDFVEDCRYGSDEECEFPVCSYYDFTCDNGQCINSKQRCDLVPDCIDGSDEHDCETTSNGFLCWDETCIPAHAYCDGQTDCEGRTFEDEPSKVPGSDCVLPITCSIDEIQCRNGVCTDSSYRCLYGFDKYGWTIGCRDQTHLLDCGDFKCPEATIKCPNSYCISLKHRCDGFWDCPNGEDEYQCGLH